jgi:hypothetical protein
MGQFFRYLLQSGAILESGTILEGGAIFSVISNKDKN